jgi:hypothetical protein
MKNTVFIHTNAKQIVGAIVAAHALKRNSRTPERFDVKIIKTEDHTFLNDYEGRKFLRGGLARVWENNDLQSFTPLRFMPPELMNYKGRAVVIDPDVFAVGDIVELLERDMKGKAIFARPRPGHGEREDYIATSVMLMDCAKLKHWNCKQMFDELFQFKRDYENMIILADEPKDTIGELESVWNDFDRLEDDTKLVHNTKRRTQPWKSGLKVDFTNRIKLPFLAKLMGTNGIRLPGRYKNHPDPHQEKFFYTMVAECMENGMLTDGFLREEMAKNHIRHDSIDLVNRMKKAA